MTRVGVDFAALRAGSGQVEQARDCFGRFAGQVGGTSGAAAPDPGATVTMERLLESVAGALHQAAGELDDLAAGLTATASGYQRLEQVLSNWNVPGETTLRAPTGYTAIQPAGSTPGIPSARPSPSSPRNCGRRIRPAAVACGLLGPVPGLSRTWPSGRPATSASVT